LEKRVGRLILNMYEYVIDIKQAEPEKLAGTE